MPGLRGQERSDVEVHLGLYLRFRRFSVLPDSGSDLRKRGLRFALGSGRLGGGALVRHLGLPAGGNRGGLGDAASRRQGTHPLFESGEPVDTDTHLTELFADRAIDFMQRSEESGDPFFCLVAQQRCPAGVVARSNWWTPRRALGRVHSAPF